MLNRDDALNLLATALRHSTAEQTEVVLVSRDHGLTRLANGGIHQNIAVSDTTALVRAVIGQRVGVASANRPGSDDIRALVDQAIDIARVSEPNPDFAGLPAPQPPASLTTPTDTITDDTGRGMHLTMGTESEGLPFASAYTPERRAAMAVTLIDTARGNGVTAAGRVSTTLTSLAVGNSLGVQAYHAWPESSVMAIMTHGDGSGFAQWDGGSPDDAPVGDTAARAASICLSAQHPTPVEAGHYTVILEPPAVAEMLVMLAFTGLGATAYQEGRSFMNDNIGKPLVDASINLSDDTYRPGMVLQPFDFEGVPKQRVPFFTRGVADGVVYDSFTAHKDGRHSTGHALPPPNSYGPLPWNLVLNGGTLSRERMLDGVTRGILVTRFHYVNVVHPKETTLTGMTRDGTFLIENGAITRPVKNLRFTQSILEALRHVSGIENRQTLLNMEGMYCLVPALRIEDFAFTSVSGTE